MPKQKDEIDQLSSKLRKIYGGRKKEDINLVASQLLQILASNRIEDNLSTNEPKQKWDSSTVILITYPDVVTALGEPTLKTLSTLIDKKFSKLSSVLHILPFLSSTSDAGFAVSSYEDIDCRFGDWKEINNLAKNHTLMADLVLNHVSSSHPWVKQFLNSEEPGNSYILAPSSNKGWGKVIRPRNTSLFTKLSTNTGNRSVWTTFGPDQIDLDWSNPSILIEFLELIVRYLKHGVRWIRLDAIAFIWKENDTTCLHLNEVHEIVKILRYQLQKMSSKSVLITETNVPETENLSYLTNGDQANLVYNFPLPPLLLECLITKKADLLNKWLNTWNELPKSTSFLNFTASHDGIGLRALEGLMDDQRIHSLLMNIERRGGLISHRRLPNGEDHPYELNISWWSAMADMEEEKECFQRERFLLSQIFAMSLKGVPAFYLQSILASNNDRDGFAKTGERRDLNREKFNAKDLFSLLEDPTSFASLNIEALNHAMEVRSKLTAFHPEASMECLSESNNDELVIFTRGQGLNTVWAFHNMTNFSTFIEKEELIAFGIDIENNKYKDYLTDSYFYDVPLSLKPYGVIWLAKS